jgi:hypothetical protein
MEGSIYVCLYFPSAGTGVQASMFSIGSKDLTAAMTGSRSISFINIVFYLNSCQFTLVPDHVDDLAVWPVMQTLVYRVTVIHVFPNAMEISDCNLFYSSFSQRSNGMLQYVGGGPLRGAVYPLHEWRGITAHSVLLLFSKAVGLQV